MQIYILWFSDQSYYPATIMGLYSTVEKAEVAKKEVIAKRRKESYLVIETAFLDELLNSKELG